MQKQVTIPLGLLFLPIVTAALFLLFLYSVFGIKAGAVLSPSQPAWEHFCFTHQRLLGRLWLVGMGGSVLNAALTTLYLSTPENSTAVGPKRLGVMTPLFAAVGITLPLSFAALWAGNHTSLFNTPPLSHGASIRVLVEDYLFPYALIFLLVGVIMVLWGSATLLIFLSALRCLNELWNCLRHPESIRVRATLEPQRPFVS